MARQPKCKTGSKPKKRKDTKKLPKKFVVTEPLARHREEFLLMLKFSGTISGFATGPEQRARRAKTRSDLKAGKVPERLEVFVLIDEDWKSSKYLAPYRQVFFEMFLCRTVDNFLTYLSDLLSLIFETNPDVLTRTQETVPIQTVFQHSSLDDLRSEIVERRIMNLSYRGMKELQTYLAEPTQLNFKIFTTKEGLQFASYVIQIRNIIVHNRGVINRAFLYRIPKEWRSHKVGDKISLSGESMDVVHNFFISATSDIDERASKKFRLPRLKETPS